MEALIGAVFVKNYNLKDAFNLLYVFDFDITHDCVDKEYIKLIQEEYSMLIPIESFKKIYEFIKQDTNYF